MTEPSPHVLIAGSRRADRLKAITDYPLDQMASCHERRSGPFTGLRAVLRSVVPEANKAWPELVDTHRPGAFVLRGQGPEAGGRGGEGCGQLALRVFRPPRPARVALDSGQPDFIAAAGVRGKVIERAGPWRTSGNWWTKDPWSRDEWDIALSDGAVYRLYCDPRGWFVEGSYD